MPATPLTVFVLDDDAAVRQSLAALIESSGRRAQCFASAEAFLAALDRSLPGCLILDMRMPDMSGLEVLARLHPIPDTLPVIVVTGHADVPLAVKALKAGARDFIEKPVEPTRLIAAIEEAVAAVERRRAEQADMAAVGSRLASLTPRERDVLKQLIIGRPNKTIGAVLAISPRTVEVHRARVMEKMEAKSLSHLIRMALAAGIKPEADGHP